MFHTPNVQVVSGRIHSDGAERAVINPFRDFTLVMDVIVRRSLYGRDLRAAANFRIIRTTDNRVFNHFWNGMLDKDFDLGGEDFWLSMSWERPEDAGAGGGFYIFRPFFVVDANQYSGRLMRPTGGSEFGVVQTENYFYVELATRPGQGSDWWP